MALHGTINVNGAIIGRWSAQRIATANPNTYACEVHMLDQPIRRFEVHHYGDDGAAALAAKVLSEGSGPLQCHGRNDRGQRCCRPPHPEQSPCA